MGRNSRLAAPDQQHQQRHTAPAAPGSNSTSSDNSVSDTHSGITLSNSSDNNVVRNHQRRRRLRRIRVKGRDIGSPEVGSKTVLREAHDTNKVRKQLFALRKHTKTAQMSSSRELMKARLRGGLLHIGGLRTRKTLFAFRLSQAAQLEELRAARRRLEHNRSTWLVMVMIPPICASLTAKSRRRRHRLQRVACYKMRPHCSTKQYKSRIQLRREPNRCKGCCAVTREHR